ncbi:MAG: hypothetical protein JSW62_05835 [Thermoplasmatales archaeon]|nr:MAG: hypothetical protein JSW62_05835 [Thermoplasmatales archaeon]
MKKKIVGIVILTLVLSCTISTANVIKNENNLNESEGKISVPSNRGQTILSPPWMCGGAGNKDSSLGGYADYSVDFDEYKGDFWTKVGANGIGWGQTNCYFTHVGEYKTPISGLYDFTLKYEYDVDLKVTMYDTYGGDHYVRTNIYINGYLSFSGDSIEKTIELDNNVYEDISYHWDSFQDTIDIKFNDIYIQKDTNLLIGVDARSWPLEGRIFAVGNCEGQVWWNSGKLLQIVIDDPTNTKPNKPNIDGPPSGNTGTSYTYGFTSTDPDNDQIKYFIKWGDGSDTGWTSYYNSGSRCTKSHTWNEMGTYTIEAKAKDEQGLESDWAKMNVIIPRSRNVNKLFYQGIIERVLEIFPGLTKIFSIF